jgi:hypothetical protein
MADRKSAPEQETVAAFRARRRRERWNAFFTPFLTLASIVASVGLLMSLIKGCQERFPNNPFLNPAERQPASGLPPKTP